MSKKTLYIASGIAVTVAMLVIKALATVVNMTVAIFLGGA